MLYEVITSVVGKSFPGMEVSLGQEVIGRSRRVKVAQSKTETPVSETTKEVTAETPESMEQAEQELVFKQKIRGRIAFSSYSAFSNATSRNNFV